MLDETDNTTLNSGGNSTSGIPAPRRRRAASRPAGAPAPVETMGTPVAIAAAGSGGSIVTSDVEVSDLPRPPMGRRRKATSTPRDVKTDVPKVVALEPTPEEPESADTRTEEKPRRTRRGASETAPSTEAERGTSQRRRATRRRSSRTAEKVEETTEATTATNKGDGADDDPINVALTEAKARARNHKVEGALANPFGFKEGEERSASDILDSLAVEIGGGEAAMPKRRRRRATRPSEAGSHSAETSGSTDKVAPVEEDKGEVKDRHSSDKKSEKSDYDTTDAVEETAADTEEDGQNRRRRRRGGRRRRRSEDTEDSASEDESSDSDDSQTSSDNDSESSSSDATHRRRRRRRRRGEDISGSDDDPSDVVIKVREPRSRQSVADEVTGIEGSTRVEAKKQRRREGRAAGRRRSAVITDAEFLARRESVDRKMIVRQSDDYSQLAVLEDGVLVEHYVDRASATSSIGNIYLGKVQNVLPSMEAAFIDIGRGRNAVLYAGEVDWAKYGKEGEDKRIEHVLKSGDQVLVQVTKDPVGAKGARLTSHISVPGRFVVYSPGGHLSGISRKLADSERKRLKKIVENNIPSDASVIVRTAAEGATEEDLVRDINRLKVQWEVIERKVSNSKAPLMLYTEPDLTVRIIRDLFTADFSELVIAGNGGPDDAYDTIKAYVDHVAPEMTSRLIHWEHTDKDPFAEYRIDEQVAKALERKVYLPSGGSLVIDRTEAMTVIDVNTGKFTGSAGNLEATVTANNLEAAEEIVRQLRLRDIGGIIVIDFIDMVLPTNRELLVRRLTECLGRDRTRHQVAEVTSLGLVQMTRKKIGTGLAEAFTEQCEACGGRGYRRFDKPVDSQAPADGGERSKGRGRGHKGSSGKSHSK
ncbi:Rne/Rng family ribonuclease [Cutibacterium acnes]|uniref:S1 motif domain-containing protein n=4 Tax=Cutibacterium TaxID=1912216 RepID=A0ABM7GY79_CUTAC|nr:Rne/Rng family ribonuclease [Cutibacterium acnes]ADE00394.1 S1 RNA binding domain protein [Cutibacterium acnes SK137]AEE72052.1 ribonuclease E [Cutibacterium acnes 266]AEW78910.1 ribonuclease, Rne/Rng family protein [Cutibacterium acnes TypeIA2 P.acn33]AEW81153.1 ribonuclease, Rne/Rng family protein [Cutibacterium acnes TypeIA2 P.acn17]AEW83417.1 ribonuclease, Rne/Rng family protein [Cutibacterium acnes TypeIA2 P.acn31]AFU40646.1 ribonuclease E [Cutibacterium acnes C1]AGJ80138.1 putative 